MSSQLLLEININKNMVESEIKKMHIELRNDNNDNEMKYAVESASDASHQTLMVAFVDFKQESIILDF